MIYIYGLLMKIMSIIIILALVTVFFVLLFFLIKKAVKDGILEANEAINKKDAREQALPRQQGEFHSSEAGGINEDFSSN